MSQLRRYLLIVFLILVFTTTLIVEAQTSELNLPTEIIYQFGSQLTLSGSLQGETPISRAIIFLRPVGGEDILIYQASIIEEPGGQNFLVTLNLRTSPIQPFQMLSFWWQVDFADGTIATSQTEEFRYEDNRFSWQERSDGRTDIHWVNGSVSYGEDLLELTKRSLDNIRQSLGLMPPGNLAIYIYPSAGDLQSGLQIGGASWIGGHTIPELGVILLAGSETPEALIVLERDLPHELTHLLLYEKMGKAYHNLPAWLNEGLATLQETQANPAYRFELEQAVAADALLSMESLCATFPIAESDALLAYAQSASFTQYLLDVYGMGGILQLLDAYREGTTCTGGIQRVYQRPLSQLESEWKTLHLQSPSLWQQMKPILPWGLFLVLLVILILVGFSARQRRNSPHSNQSHDTHHSF
jgi:hypothetical protein